jgi:hypothetical protein
VLTALPVTHSETIREKIKEQMAISSAAKRSAEQMEKDALTAIKLEPIGMDRNKKRVWSLDGKLAALRLPANIQTRHGCTSLVTRSSAPVR